MQASNEIKIAVTVYQDAEGYFIGEAVDYPGIMAFAKDEETLGRRLIKAAYAIFRAKAYQPNFRNSGLVSGHITELSIPLAA